MLGATTIGNATLIAYDNHPVLATDPWFGDEDPAYFGSWVLSHVIPAECHRDIMRAEYIWFSHGHPDHLNPLSLERLKGKRILLPDHVGARIDRDLRGAGFSVAILPDRRWVELSPRIKVMCITTSIQDAVLLVDINGQLFVDLNDSGGRNCSRFIQKIADHYEHSYLLALSGYGDADMINLYDDQGRFIVPPAERKAPVGVGLTKMAKKFGVRAAIPFSSFHAYQRADSVWAERYVTTTEDYPRGFDSRTTRFIAPFSFIDCTTGDATSLAPSVNQRKIKDPTEFGDDWSEPLGREDIATLTNYFVRKERVRDFLSFINFRVGGKDNVIPLQGRKDKGVTFDVPRTSLMAAIGFKAFDDLLIGNFMKTTLHNLDSLYDGDLNFIITKYGDNGGAESDAEITAYLREYRRRAGHEWYYDKVIDRLAATAKANISHESVLYSVARRVYAML